jgi:hypothetical protein
MVDYYGLPKSGEKAWPGRAAAAKLAYTKRAAYVEDALLKDFIEHAGNTLDVRRFLPFVVMHEFEGLLFSDCAAFASAIGRPKIESDLQKIRDEFETPEHINDSPVTAPSKRVISLVPGYRKPLLGTLASLEIGLETIQAECPHFRPKFPRGTEISTGFSGGGECGTAALLATNGHSVIEERAAVMEWVW